MRKGAYRLESKQENPPRA